MKSRRITVLSLTAGFFLCVASSAQAARFSNQFVEFELPPRWQCNLEGAEWVCQNTVDAKKRDALIVLAAKLKGSQDSLDQYLTYLKQPKTYKSVKGQMVKAEPKYAKPVNINGHAWVDSFHAESEIPGFYTRYLATIKNDIGVLVTYSVDKNKYREYLQEFDVLVKTLRVFRKPGSVNSQGANANLFQQAIPDAVSQGTVFPDMEEDQEGRSTKKSKSSSEDILFLGGIIAAAIGYIVWRRKQSKGNA